jgi:hypothetical protein
MAAGTILTNAGAAAASQPVQMLTTTWDTFNHMYFMYQMLSAIEILIVAFLFWTFRPYIPFVVSKIWTHLPVVGLMNRVRNTAPFGGFTLRNGMYRKEMKNTTMYYVKKYLGSFFFMGCSFDIVHIDRGFVQDPIMNKYVVSLTAQGYPRWRDIEDALFVNDIDPILGTEVQKDVAQYIAEGYGCRDYKELKEFLNPYGLTKTALIYAPKYSNIPQDSLLGFGKNAPPGALAAWVDHWFEFTKPDIEKDKIMEWLPYVLLIIAICLGGYILAAAVQHGHG